MSWGKTLQVFLMDGEPNGRIKCTLANWTGIAYKIPNNKEKLEKSKDIGVLKQSGVYFLFGMDDKDPEVYIGQAGVRKNGEGLLLRIQEDHPSMEFWNEAVMFTTTNGSFGPTEISYLENRFYKLADNANRYNVKNNIEPSLGNVTEEKESELEEFIEYAAIIMGALGHKVFEPYTAISSDADKGPLLYFEYNGYKATGKRTNNGFLVCKGSQINPNMTNACPASAVKNRKKYAAIIDYTNRLTKDVELSSPSAAACFVGGASLSGNVMWKDENGKTLRQLNEEMQAEASE